MNAGAALHPVPDIEAVPITTGASVSCIQVMVCTNGALWLPQSSTKIHVLVCVVTQLSVVAVEVCGLLGYHFQIGIVIGYAVKAFAACPGVVVANEAEQLDVCSFFVQLFREGNAEGDGAGIAVG